MWGDTFTFITNQGSPWELFRCCFLYPPPFPALFADFLPTTLCSTLFSMSPQAKKFQVQAVGPPHHSSPSAAFQCSLVLSCTPFLFLPHLFHPIATEEVTSAGCGEHEIRECLMEAEFRFQQVGVERMDITEKSIHIEKTWRI